MAEKDSIPLTPERFEELAAEQGGLPDPDSGTLARIADDVETFRDELRDISRKFDELLKTLESLARILLEQ